MSFNNQDRNGNASNASLLKLSGLWNKTSKKGDNYISGTISAGALKELDLDTDINVFVFDRHPKSQDDPNKSYPQFLLCAANKTPKPVFETQTPF